MMYLLYLLYWPKSVKNEVSDVTLEQFPRARFFETKTLLSRVVNNNALKAWTEFRNQMSVMADGGIQFQTQPTKKSCLSTYEFVLRRAHRNVTEIFGWVV